MVLMIIELHQNLKVISSIGNLREVYKKKSHSPALIHCACNPDRCNEFAAFKGIIDLRVRHVIVRYTFGFDQCPVYQIPLYHYCWHRLVNMMANSPVSKQAPITPFVWNIAHYTHEEVMTWKRFPHDLLIVGSPLDSPHKEPSNSYMDHRYFLQCC